MRTLLTTIFLVFSSTIFGQYIENDGSFTREYTSIRGYKNVDGELIYDEGSAVQWTFVFNVNTSADGGNVGCGHEQYRRPTTILLQLHRRHLRVGR